jgi:hypothetical protein
MGTVMGTGGTGDGERRVPREWPGPLSGVVIVLKWLVTKLLISRMKVCA